MSTILQLLDIGKEKLMKSGNEYMQNMTGRSY